MNVDESELSTSKNSEGKNAVHDIDILDKEEKAIKLDSEENTSHFNECNKEVTNISKFMKKNLIKELDAQNLRIFSIENKRKQRDILMMEIVRKK